MAKTLQITDGTTTVDLLTGNLDLAANGWSTKTASDGEGIWEVFEIVSNASDADLRTAKADFDTLIEQARVYRQKPYESVPVVLKWQSEGETARQALVLDGESEILADDIYSPLLGLTGGGALIRLAVKRHPSWELLSAQTSGSDDVSTLGGSFAISITDNGTAPGRISSLLIDDGPVTALNKIWCGIRPTRLGTAGFISVWEAENGTNFTDAADTVDATASDGNQVTIDFATTTTLAKRFTLRWGQVAGGNYDDIIGRYLVLGRVKLSSAATEVAVQLRHGFAGSAAYEAIVGTTYLSAVDNTALTNWNLVELGVVDIPPTGNRSGIVSSTMDDYFLLLYAEQLAGASLLFDCFVLIPAEHMVTAKGALVDSNVNSLLNYFTGPDDFQTAVGVQAAGLNYNCEFSFENWEFPIAGGLLVFAGQAQSLHALSQDVDLLLSIVPRFKSFHA